MWYIINKQTKLGILQSLILIFVLKIGTVKITNLQTVTDMLNSFFIEHVEALLAKSKNYVNGPTSQIKIKHNFNTMFVFSVAEDELESVVGKLREKYSAGFDVIPEYLFMKCIQYIKKRLAHIFNTSLKSGIFPDKMKTAKV